MILRELLQFNFIEEQISSNIFLPRNFFFLMFIWLIFKSSILIENNV